MAFVYFPVRVRFIFPRYVSRQFKCKACLTAEDSVHNTRTTLYSQKLTGVMMVSPWMFTESFVGSHLFGISKTEELFTGILLFNISRDFCFCFCFSFRSGKDGIVGEERVSFVRRLFYTSFRSVL